MADLDITSTVEEKVPITLNPKTAGGKPAPVDGAPVWSFDGTGTVEVAADGLSAFIVSADEPGSGRWKAVADVKLGEEFEAIEIGGTYTYTSANASNLGATVGAAVPK